MTGILVMTFRPFNELLDHVLWAAFGYCDCCAIDHSRSTQSASQTYLAVTSDEIEIRLCDTEGTSTRRLAYNEAFADHDIIQFENQIV
jgi:hypothetical protein